MHSFFSFVNSKNSRLLYEPNNNHHLPKSVGTVSLFRFRFVFIKAYIFFQKKSMESPLTSKRHNSFRN